MKAVITHRDWHPSLLSLPSRTRNWLQSRGSLTQMIQQRCTRFRVEPVRQSLARPHEDELSVMKLRHGELALVREVYLYCGHTPVIFAHSVVSRENLRGAWRSLNNLGRRSLGTVLFSNPAIERTPFGFKKIDASHPLCKRACQHLQTRPADLWARRSLFTLHGQSILVTEVFLPDILGLA
jgi:chorismate lyase